MWKYIKTTNKNESFTQRNKLVKYMENSIMKNYKTTLGRESSW